PDVATRVFQGVQQPVCIVLAVKDGSTDSETPASVLCTSVSGHRDEKFSQLAGLGLEGDEWVPAPSGWRDPFLPAPSEGWQPLPALADLLPASSPGVSAHRTWPISPSKSTLTARGRKLLDEPDLVQRALLLHETRDTKLTST